MGSIPPAYVTAHLKGLLARAAETARKRLASCTLCPRQCRVNRLEGETGVCRTGEKAMVSSCNAHFGEESPLVGTRGSGTIFFAHCNLLCVFCQNFDLSHGGQGIPTSARELADLMLSLQSAGCHNINFVTPSHVAPQILQALDLAVAGGLHIPLVYNSSGYDRVETLKLLEGIFDIYMPDFKFWNPETARRLCDAADYPEAARAAIREMHRQVGDLVVDDKGVAVRGLLIRHLVLPDGFADTRDVMRFIAREVSANSYVNIMSQYRPCGRASEFPPMDRAPAPGDHKRAVETALAEGISRLDQPVRRLAFW
jgi:putative pyruvate formate lyase activating enzyme